MGGGGSKTRASEGGAPSPEPDTFNVLTDADLAARLWRLGFPKHAVQDLRGDPIYGATVTATDQAGEQWSGKTDSTGAFTLLGLSEGEFSLKAKVSPYCDADPGYAPAWWLGARAEDAHGAGDDRGQQSEDGERDRVLDQERGAARAEGQLPAALRPLAVIEGLARRSLRAGGGPMLGDRLSPLVALRLGLFGR